VHRRLGVAGDDGAAVAADGDVSGFEQSVAPRTQAGIATWSRSRASSSVHAARFLMSGVTVETLRFYERRGLLSTPAR
jgi:hypothetical protein